MKKRLFFAFALLASPALAQTAPTIDDVRAESLMETGQLRYQLGQAMVALKARDAEIAKLKADVISVLKAENEKLKADLAVKAKPEPSP